MREWSYARRLLQARLPVNRVAAQCGYVSTSYFYLRVQGNVLASRLTGCWRFRSTGSIKVNAEFELF